jgi:hypothetical protein
MIKFIEVRNVAIENGPNSQSQLIDDYVYWS